MVCNIQFIIVIFTVAPEIAIPPNSITIDNGSEAALNCTIIGDPVPSISWFVVSGVDLSLLFSNNLTIPFDEQGRINDSLITNTMPNRTSMFSSLRLPQTAPFIAGEYECRGSNDVGTINRNATITVYGK